MNLTRSGGRRWRLLYAIMVLCLAHAADAARAGVIFGANGINGGSRWDAAPRTISGRERSLAGGLRFSVTGGSYLAFRDQFSWSGGAPSLAAFQAAVEAAFNAWTAVDPATGLSTALSFVADFATPVVGVSGFGGVNIAGSEIDVLAKNAGDTGARGFTNFNAIASTVRLTSGTLNYPGSFAISGADISLNSNPGALYTLDYFRRLLTHEIGHALGLGDVESSINPNRFIDDNYNGSNSATALATLTNSWALKVNPLNPAASPLNIYNVPNGATGIGAAGVNLLMESNGLGIATGNPLTNLFPMTNDDYGMRQFLYPMLVPEPATAILLFLGGAMACLTHGRRSRHRGR